MAVALVTGGARRIGAEICRRLAAAGYSVIVHFHQSRADAESLVEELSETNQVWAIQADLADEQSVQELWLNALQSAGKIDLLVNNACHFEYDNPTTFSYGVLHDSIAINCGAPLTLTKSFSEQREVEGCIINILDQKLANPNPDYLSYTASKGALAALIQPLAIALAPNIRINAVAPGLTLPSPHASREIFEKVHTGTILGSGSSPRDIGDAVVFLATAQSITGEVLHVDGGERLKRSASDSLYGKE